MAEDFVKDISPLNQIAPVRPHPSNIRQERRRRGGKKQGKGKGDQDRDGLEDRPLLVKDKVSVLAKGHDDPQGPPKPGKKVSQKDNNESVRHIDIRV